ncbi:unnamed protein product [Protopolystoma xenopodis]|uniref:RNA helicase aquarius N-terminal domain-containing protein n=1 Tax=Protopolystoma xenopodis TaxID=117903 RepID=A0A448WN63_9PLAT|nr:unnamed protein product [Protopolystoma xenopodis]
MARSGDSVDYVAQSRINQLARTYWLPDDEKIVNSQEGTETEHPWSHFREELVITIYREELLATGFSHKRCQLLEISQYLETYLWPNFSGPDPDFEDQGNTGSSSRLLPSREHVLSLCVMVNEKARERVPIWTVSFISVINIFKMYFLNHPQIKMCFLFLEYIGS